MASCELLDSSSSSFSSDGEPVAGDSAPDFQLTTLDGKNKTLQDYRGKTVILNFWALWCPPCVSELPALSNLQEELKDSDVVVLTINVDSPEQLDKVKAHLAENNFSFQTLLDPELSSVNKYGVTGFPETVFIDKNGKFFAVMDPTSNKASAKFIRDRQWDSPPYVDLFRSNTH